MKKIFKIILFPPFTFVLLVCLFFIVVFIFFPKYETCRNIENITIKHINSEGKYVISLGYNRDCECLIPHPYRSLIGSYAPGGGGFNEELKELYISSFNRKNRLKVNDLFNYKYCSNAHDTIFQDKNSFIQYFNSNRSNIDFMFSKLELRFKNEKNRQLINNSDSTILELSLSDGTRFSSSLYSKK